MTNDNLIKILRHISIHPIDKIQRKFNLIIGNITSMSACVNCMKKDKMGFLIKSKEIAACNFI
jgi:hypothetical protein